MTYIPTKQQTVDVLTKSLHKPSFEAFVTKLGVKNIYILTWGEVLEYSVIMMRMFYDLV